MDEQDRDGRESAAAARVAEAARRALAEAEARRAASAAELATTRPKEIDGRQGPEPVRYGDWEKNGIAYDF